MEDPKVQTTLVILAIAVVIYITTCLVQFRKLNRKDDAGRPPEGR